MKPYHFIIPKGFSLYKNSSIIYQTHVIIGLAVLQEITACPFQNAIPCENFKRFFRNNVLRYNNKDIRFNSGICFQNIRVGAFFRNLMMQTLQRNTTTAQIPHVRVVPVSLRNASSYAWFLFTLLTSKGLFEGFFGLYLYLYLYFYLYSNDRW